MSEPETLRQMLYFLGWLMDDPSHLSPTKFNAEVAKAARLEARGWKHLAGEGTDNPDELLKLLYDAPTPFLQNRNVPEGNGRRAGSKDSRYADRDALIIAEIQNGGDRQKAIRARYRIRKQYATHARRIKRKLEEINAETRRIIALQTPYLRSIKD